MKWFAVPILSLMNWLYAHVHNYGVAIILLTVLSKVPFYPLTGWSMRSMKAMQTLQPQINALRSKYRAIRSACSARRWSSTASTA